MISPGAIALTRIPSGPRSDAISRVSAASAAFDVAYAAPAKGCTRLPAIEVTFTMHPLPRVSSSTSPCASITVANRLTWNTWSQVAGSVSITPSRSPSGPLGETPALLTSALSGAPSRRPLRSSIPSSRLSRFERSITT